MASTAATHTYNGSCLCGSIKVVLSLDEDLLAKPNGHLCHCKNCRKFSGGPSAMCLMVPTSAVQLSDTKKSLKTYQDGNTKSGNTVPRMFCSDCGSPVGCVPGGRDERLSLLALGLFDEIPMPMFECFTSSRLPWNKPAADAERQYEFIDEIVKHVPKLE